MPAVFSSLTSLTVEIETRDARPRRISVLGATGSIGESTLDLDRPRSIGLSGRRADRRPQCRSSRRTRHSAPGRARRHRRSCAPTPTLRDALAGTGIEVGAGEEALLEAASRPADWVMAAIVGAAGLKPTLEAVRQGSLTALANKECLVSAGDIFMAEVARAKTTLLPVDSEHSAAMQVMAGRRAERIERVCLTASGGPFRCWSLDQMRAARARAGAQPSQLVDGAEGHDQFGDADEQGARADRGASSVLASGRDSSMF